MNKNAKILRLKNQNINVYSFKCVDSTNIIARQLATKGCDEGTTVVAAEQTAGKGRLGRTFLSQKGGVYFSTILRPDLPLDDVLFITVAAAVAAARAIENISGKKCDIKWVNDIYIDGKKVCGILTEGNLDVDKNLEYAILGVGINLFEPKGGFPGNLPLAGSVFSKNNNVMFKNHKKRQIVESFVNIFFDLYKNIDKKEFIKEYQTRSFLTGKDITYTKDGVTCNAKVVGIDDDAKLLVKIGEKLERLSHGEIQIIGMEQLII